MSAVLVSIDSVDQKPNAHAERRISDFYAAWRLLEEQLKASGVAIDNGSASGAAFQAAHAMADAWKSRALRLEQQLRAALACDALTDDTRQGILRALYGKRGTNRFLCSEAEARLLEEYRVLDAAERQMLRTLVDRLASSGRAAEKGGAQ